MTGSSSYSLFRGYWLFLNQSSAAYCEATKGHDAGGVIRDARILADVLPASADAIVQWKSLILSRRRGELAIPRRDCSAEKLPELAKSNVFH